MSNLAILGAAEGRTKMERHPAERRRRAQA